MRQIQGRGLVRTRTIFDAQSVFVHPPITHLHRELAGITRFAVATRIRTFQVRDIILEERRRVLPHFVKSHRAAVQVTRHAARRVVLRALFYRCV